MFMMHHSSLWIRSTLTAASAVAFSSCVYDPGYYSGPGSSYPNYSGGVSTTYSSGGYSSTSLFISTGNPRWGYDPSCYSYYDYTTRCYYDPYLNGYYPYGYRPMVVYGAPHPYGWRPGHHTCPPPRHYRNTRLSNHEHRDVAYRNLNESWSKNVKVKTDSNDRYHRDHQSSNNPSSMNRSVAPTAVAPPTRDRNDNREIKPPSGSSWDSRKKHDSDRQSTPKPSREHQPRVEDQPPQINTPPSVQYRQTRESSSSHRSNESRESFQGGQSGSNTNQGNASSSSGRQPSPTREKRNDDDDGQKSSRNR